MSTAGFFTPRLASVECLTTIDNGLPRIPVVATYISSQHVLGDISKVDRCPPFVDCSRGEPGIDLSLRYMIVTSWQSRIAPSWFASDDSLLGSFGKENAQDCAT